MTPAGRGENVALIVLPLIAFTLLCDQITKYVAVAKLCVFGPFSSPMACTALDGLRLADASVWSVDRFATFLPIIDLDFHRVGFR